MGMTRMHVSDVTTHSGVVAVGGQHPHPPQHPRGEGVGHWNPNRSRVYCGGNQHNAPDCGADPKHERWGAGVETQKNVREEIGGWGRVPFNEPYAPSLSTIYDGA